MIEDHVKSFLPAGFITLVVLGFLLVMAGLIRAEEPSDLVTVTRIVDGDTIEVQFADNTKHKVRMLFIDTPELSSKECYSTEATQYLSSLINGKQITLKYGAEKLDPFNRILAFVYYKNSNVNAFMVKTGMAYLYPSKPLSTESSRYIKYERDARKSKVGLWGFCYK